MDNYITILPTSCINFNHVIKKFCLPEKTLCDHTIIDGLFVDCGNQWNCNLLCALDKPYYINMPTNGKIMLQTNFNTSKNPVEVWGSQIKIELYDQNDVFITDDHTTFSSRYMVGYTGKYGFQNIEIDASQITLNCFYFKIKFNVEEVCTQLFKKAECDDIIEIESTYSDYDCWNNYYKPSSYGFTGTSNFAYSNKIYLKGKYKYFGTSVSEDKLTEIIRFYPSELISPYMAKYLSFKILKAKKSIINGEYWDNKSNNLTPRDRSSMFFNILEFERSSCGVNNSCKSN